MAIDREVNNVGMTVTETARQLPQGVAIAAATRKRRQGRRVYQTISFAELAARSDSIAAGFEQWGVAPGTRIALMVPPGIDFVAFVFGLFKAGMVVILIDPGMGRRNMLTCLSEAAPRGVVGIRAAQLARTLFRGRFPDCRYNVLVGGRFWPGCRSAAAIEQSGHEHLNGQPFQPPTTSWEESAAIIFTTGSTGPPKGVLYRHRVFIEQARQIQQYFQIQPGTVDVSGFPLFALFNTAMGTTTVFPWMDPTRPADVDPREIIDAVEQFSARQSFGSPALWNTVSRYCERQGYRLPQLKRVLSAGAPVPAHVLKRIRAIIDDEGDVFTPYGATESLPVACISATDVLAETEALTAQGRGICVGRRFPDIDWQIIEIDDGPIATIDEATRLPPGEIGELIVRGNVVTDQYVTRTEANALHKIVDGDSFWHRMGDVGYLDASGRFWFCGRKSHRVQTGEATLFTIPCEAIFNNHPKIYRSALVGIGTAGDQIPVLIAEPWPEHWPARKSEREALQRELEQRARSHPQTRPIKHVLVKKSLPVDIRHNSKIFREQLRGWAATVLSPSIGRSATGDSV